MAKKRRGKRCSQGGVGGGGGPKQGGGGNVQKLCIWGLRVKPLEGGWCVIPTDLSNY